MEPTTPPAEACAPTAPRSTAAAAYGRPRSYHPRRRRIGPGKAATLAAHGAAVVRDDYPGALDDVGGAPVLIDVGFGMGEATLDWAARHPGARVIGIDVHTPGIAHVVAGAAERGLVNVRTIAADAWQVLDAVPDAALRTVRLLFPDPWPARRQQRRRLVQAPFAEVLARTLAPGGGVRLATDDDSYARQMAEVLGSAGAFSPCTPEVRSVTRYELRGLADGRRIHELAYVRR